MKPEPRSPFGLATSTLGIALALTATAVAKDERPPGSPGGTPGAIANDERSPGSPGGTPGAISPPPANAAASAPASAPGATTRAAAGRQSGSGTAAFETKRGAAPKTIKQISESNGLVSRNRFNKLMADNFDALDKQQRGALPVDEVRKMLEEAAAK